MSFLKILFGGGAPAQSPAGKEVEHAGFLIRATPFQENGQWQTCGVIIREVAGTLREHKFIRADRFPSQDMAQDHAITKGKQIIDQQGERLFD
jgi:hypothetical protein